MGNHFASVLAQLLELFLFPQVRLSRTVATTTIPILILKECSEAEGWVHFLCNGGTCNRGLLIKAPPS